MFDSEFCVSDNLSVDLIIFDKNSRQIGKRKECFRCFDEIFLIYNKKLVKRACYFDFWRQKNSLNRLV